MIEYFTEVWLDKGVIPEFPLDFHHLTKAESVIYFKNKNSRNKNKDYVTIPTFKVSKTETEEKIASNLLEFSLLKKCQIKKGQLEKELESKPENIFVFKDKIVIIPVKDNLIHLKVKGGKEHGFAILNNAAIKWYQL